jgi:uncharacterized protein YndB with AHSA1/START domain
LGEINKQITINAPVERVYTYVSDPRHAPKYISSITKVLSGPQEEPAPDQVWRAEADFLGQKRHINLRIGELVPNRLVRFVLEGDPEAVVELRLMGDESKESTAVKLSLDANGVPSLLLNALLGGLLAQDMVRLKRLLESRAL